MSKTVAAFKEFIVFGRPMCGQELTVPCDKSNSPSIIQCAAGYSVYFQERLCRGAR